jgi:RNA-dependent RNA polymerase
MEVFMKNIPSGTSDLHLTRKLEPILHGPKFRDLFGGAPFNFIVRLLKPRRTIPEEMDLQGRLLLPSATIGNRLLSLLTTDPLLLRNKIIYMEQSESGVGPDDLITLKEPYQDPARLEVEEQRRSDISGKIPISNIQFGWQCHDGTVSAEWASELTDEWSLEFDPDTHNWVLESDTGLRILIGLRAIHSTALNSMACIFWLERCPIFEKSKLIFDPESYDHFNPILASLSDFRDLSSNGPSRDRLMTPDPDHRRIFAYFRVVRVIFDSQYHVQEFKVKAKKIGLSLYTDDPKFEARYLFSRTILKEVGLWLTSLPFEVAFQLEGLLSRCRFHPKELLELRPDLTSALTQHPQPAVCATLRALEQRREENPESSAISLFRDLITTIETNGQVRSFLQTTPDLFQCHRVVVTPTSFILHGPLPDETNRVIRKYAGYTSNFIRVEFKEEDRLQFRFDSNVDIDKFIDRRVGTVLRKDIVVAGRKFEFLAYSSSALREHAVWFMTPFRTQEGEIVTANSIRASLGDFSKVITCPARYGARISQAFSATEDSVSVEVEEMSTIPDVACGDYTFTDGVGLLSPSLAKEIWEKYTDTRSKRNRRQLQTPSAFQIRLGGLKGMLCIDERLEGRSICTRESMEKFTSNDHMIEIARAFDRPMNMYLNRYLIMVLETLGVPLQPFMELQAQAVKNTEEASSSFELATRLFERHSFGRAFRMASIMSNLHNLEIDLNSTDQELGLMKFSKRVVDFSVNHILRALKYKARIPVEKAWTLVGVADEWNYLKENEIFGN